MKKVKLMIEKVQFTKVKKVITIQDNAKRTLIKRIEKDINKKET